MRASRYLFGLTLLLVAYCGVPVLFRLADMDVPQPSASSVGLFVAILFMAVSAAVGGLESRLAKFENQYSGQDKR